MKNIPFFTTENGAASLVLREIPYSRRAYIRILDSLEPEALLRECVSFCRMAGAEQVYATGSKILDRYPFHTSVIRMRCPLDEIGDTDAALWPVQPNTLSKWRDIYHERMAGVPNSAWMTMDEAKAMLEAGEGYFVHRNGKLLGIGKVSGSKLDAVVSVERGQGVTVVRALCHAITDDLVTLEVASENMPAMKLYTKLGFIPCEEISRWFCVFQTSKK